MLSEAKHPFLDRLADVNSDALPSLRHKLADLATLQAIVLPVFAKSHLVESLADSAILIAVTGIFCLVANSATKSLSHTRTIPRFLRPEKYQLLHSCTFVTLSKGCSIANGIGARQYTPAASFFPPFTQLSRIIDPRKMRVLTYKVPISR